MLGDICVCGLYLLPNLSNGKLPVLKEAENLRVAVYYTATQVCQYYNSLLR